MYKVYIAKLKNVRPHSNADRLKCATVFENPVVVPLEYEEGQVGLYIPSDGQVGEKFAEVNNLLRKKDGTGGYLDPIKRNVRPLSLRGERSDGIFLPLTSLEPFGDTSTLQVGDSFTLFNGVEIAVKYVPKSNSSQRASSDKPKKLVTKKKTNPYFHEHKDTNQLVYCQNAFKKGDYVEATLKIHGTSQRVGFLPEEQEIPQKLWEKLLRRPRKTEKVYRLLHGTRRVQLDDFEGGFYGTNDFRRVHGLQFEGKLRKGETVYFEVAGFTENGTPIMPTVDNRKLKDKDFVREYGTHTTFSYGCDPTGENAPRSKSFVYRMARIDEDGYVTEYSPSQTRERCEQMGVEYAPVLFTFFYNGQEEKLIRLAEEAAAGIDLLGRNHIREGVVFRIVNRPYFEAYKYKSYEFRVLEGIIKEEATEPDLEEL